MWEANIQAEDFFLPRCCTKQPQLHQATLNYESEGHVKLGILIFSLEKWTYFST